MRERPELVWETYQSLENEFLDCIDYIPLSEEHYSVWSYKLANLLNNVGSSVDSFFKNAIECKSLDDFKGITKIRDPDAPRNMKVYRDIFNGRYNLSKKTIFEIKNYTTIYPYKEWSELGTLNWWNDYLKIKHDRFENHKRATLKTTLDALGALFLLFLNQKETIPMLVDIEIIKSGFEKDYCTNLLFQGEPLKEIGSAVYAKTSLFGYVFEPQYQIDNAERKRILSPRYSGY